MTTIMTLRNYLETPVEFKWDGELYRLEAGEEVKLPEGIARHGAKYVAMASYPKDKAIAQITDEFQNRIAKALSSSETHDSDTKAEVALANDKAKKKASKKKKEEEDEVFEGL